MVPGFEILIATNWTVEDSGLLISKFKGRASQWQAKNLQTLRKRLREDVLLQQKYRCSYCRRKISSSIGGHEIDHVIPKSLHPKFTYTKINLVASCKRCNWLKREYDPVAANCQKFPETYPMKVDDWNWIHPYIHKYSEHITIKEGLFFVATKHDELKRKRALKVIEVCKLASITTIEKRAMYELAIASVDLFTAILELIGAFPKTSASVIATQIKVARKLKAERAVIIDAICEARKNKGQKMLALLANEIC
ncbi:HNH endonuclease [Undibacterium sp. Tian12W]|uniref:HNH endonuclease n=1 Tax=Undibacterium sp. Tian12W TaxID=3413054 RepID=UPI003BF18738